MDKKIIEQNQIKTFSLVIIALVSTSFALYYTKSVLVPFVLAVFLKILISPIIDFQINKLRIQKYIAMFVAIIIVILFFILIIPPLYNSIRTFLSNAGEYQDRVILLVDFLLRWAQDKFGLEIDIITIEESIRELPFLDFASDLLGHTAHFFESTFIILVLILFLIIGDSAKPKTAAWLEIDVSIKKYISTKFLIAFGTSMIFAIIYLSVGLDLAIIFATLTFFLTFIPVFGALIAIILPIPVAFIQYTSATPIILIILLPTMVKIIVGDFIEPKLIGSALKLHPVTIILSLIFWGMLWGIIGILLAAPITAIIKLSFEKYETTLPFARLLEGTLHLKN